MTVTQDGRDQGGVPWSPDTALATQREGTEAMRSLDRHYWATSPPNHPRRPQADWGEVGHGGERERGARMGVGVGWYTDNSRRKAVVWTDDATMM
jgi:hypothetical protein